MRTAADCERRIRELYDPLPGDDLPLDPGDVLDGSLADATGVLHITAVGRTAGPVAGAPLYTIAIGPHSPKSATDFFLLNLARARADAIVTTGKILRDEPAVEHRLQGADGEPEALAAWRRERLGKREPPLSVVLTTGREIDLFHPLFRSAPRAIILTGESAAAALRDRSHPPAVEVVARRAPSLVDALVYLRTERACDTISVEAGPSSTAALYGPALAVDELMLSILEERPLAPGECAGAFLAESEIERRFARRSPRRRLLEESGAWSFRRLRRR